MPVSQSLRCTKMVLQSLLLLNIFSTLAYSADPSISSRTAQVNGSKIAYLTAGSGDASFCSTATQRPRTCGAL